MAVNFNVVSTVMSAEDHTALLAGIKAVETLVAAFGVTLPTEEKMGLARVGIKAADFTDKAYDYAVNNETLRPAYLDMTEFGNDVMLARQLREAVNHLVPLVDMLVDTHVLASAEAYSNARIFYHHIKNAANANVTGASAIASELSKTFKIVKSKKQDDQSETPTETQSMDATPKKK